MPFQLPEPQPNQGYVEVSALEAGIITMPLMIVIQGAGPTDTSVVPSLAFSLRHKQSGEHLLFDLGVRRDIEALAPRTQWLIEKHMPIQVPQTVEESLEKGGLKREDIKTVILSHLHYDQWVTALLMLGSIMYRY